MTPTFDATRDLRISRIIRASPDVIWRAWTDPMKFERWWVPAPAKCKVVDMDLRPGGALTTQIRESGAPFARRAPFHQVVDAKARDGFAAAIQEDGLVTAARGDERLEYARRRRPQRTQTCLVPLPEEFGRWRRAKVEISDGQTCRFVSASARVVQKQK